MGSVTSIEVGERGAGGCPVGGMAWLGIAWQMNWLNNLASSVEAVGAIVGVTSVCCCGGEVTVGLVSRSFCVSCCSMPCCWENGGPFDFWRRISVASCCGCDAEESTLCR